MNLRIIWSLGVSNLIIVESENDKYFIEALIDRLNIENIEIGQPICTINDFDCLGGISKLSNRLKAIKLDKYDKLGIILDADNEGIENRIDLINNSLKEISSDIELKAINTPIKSEELNLEIACYIMNVDGRGELETVMKKVKSKPSTYADCLDAWRECLETNGIAISDKEFDKFWVSNYLKYDTCIGKDKKQKARKCANELINNIDNHQIENNLKSNEYTIKKDIWDFDNRVLDDLKNFLLLFSIEEDLGLINKSK